jgi:hypothetical protein
MPDEVEIETVDIIEFVLSDDVSLIFDPEDSSLLVVRSQDDERVPELLYTTESGWQQDIWDSWNLTKMTTKEEVFKFCETIDLSIKAPEGA